MGYTTRFEGQFHLDKPLTVPQYNELIKYAEADHRNDRDAPGYYCQWIPTEDGQGLKWDGREKFYDYVEWLRYLVEHFLKPWGITLTGEVQYQGDEVTDRGTITVKDSVVSVAKYVRDPAIPICEECGYSYDIREPHLH